MAGYGRWWRRGEFIIYCGYRSFSRTFTFDQLMDRIFSCFNSFIFAMYFELFYTLWFLWFGCIIFTDWHKHFNNPKVNSKLSFTIHQMSINCLHFSVCLPFIWIPCINCIHHKLETTRNIAQISTFDVVFFRKWFDGCHCKPWNFGNLLLSRLAWNLHVHLIYMTLWNIGFECCLSTKSNL